MKNPLPLVLALSAVISSTQAASVFWAFQTNASGGSYNGPTTATPGAGSFTSSSGFIGTPTLTGIAGSGGGAVSGFVGGVDFEDPNNPGTTWVGGGTSSPGYALNWGANNTDGQNLTGAGMIIGLNTTGLTDLSVSFHVRSATAGTSGSTGAPTGFSSISYRTDGGAWVDLSTAGTPTWSLSTSWQTSVPALDLSAYDELDNQANLELRLIFNGGPKATSTGITHNMRIDNLVVSAIPEPTAVALGALGFATMFVRRKRR